MRQDESSPRVERDAQLQGNTFWTVLPAIMAALNPVLLLVIGFFLNAGIERTKAQLEENSARLNDLKTQAETTTLALHDRVDKVKVLSDFLNDLSGPDERRRSLAIEAIFIALPDEAARLARVVEKFAKPGGPASDKDVAAAQDALAGTRGRLVGDMFSPDRATRVQALATLEKGWSDDPAVVDLLLTQASRDVTIRNGAGWRTPIDGTDDVGRQALASIYNTAQFLSFVPRPADAGLRRRVHDFLAAAAPNSRDTAAIVASISSRFE